MFICFDGDYPPVLANVAAVVRALIIVLIENLNAFRNADDLRRAEAVKIRIVVIPSDGTQVKDVGIDLPLKIRHHEGIIGVKSFFQCAVKMRFVLADGGGMLRNLPIASREDVIGRKSELDKIIQVKIRSPTGALQLRLRAIVVVVRCDHCRIILDTNGLFHTGIITKSAVDAGGTAKIRIYRQNRFFNLPSGLDVGDLHPVAINEAIVAARNGKRRHRLVVTGVCAVCAVVSIHILVFINSGHRDGLDGIGTVSPRRRAVINVVSYGGVNVLDRHHIIGITIEIQLLSLRQTVVDKVAFFQVVPNLLVRNVLLAHPREGTDVDNRFVDGDAQGHSARIIIGVALEGEVQRFDARAVIRFIVVVSDRRVIIQPNARIR